jgi:hypothetical protein
MPINRDDVLRPLGGEDNLRLMCDADGFEYTTLHEGFKASFTTPKYSVDVLHFPDRLDHSNRWALRVWNRNRAKRVHNSSSVLEPDLLALTFEWATNYSLSF